MTDEFIKVIDTLDRLEFFGGQRAGRELWAEKPFDVQNQDIENFNKDIAFIKDFIYSKNAEISALNRNLTDAYLMIDKLRGNS